MTQIKLGDIIIDIVQKDIKNLHLSVYPPAGNVKIAAPSRMSMDTIRIYALSKIGWIRKQQAKFTNQQRSAPKEYINRESHYYLGKRYLLRIVHEDCPPSVTLNRNTIILTVRPEADMAKRMQVLEQWYRDRLKEQVRTLINKWEKKMDVKVLEFGVKKMKTKWGTCNASAQRIWLNLELAKKPPLCLEYIVVHEMVHLLERNHNDRFTNYMDNFLPEWRHYREELNRLPISHVDWGY